MSTRTAQPVRRRLAAIAAAAALLAGASLAAAQAAGARAVSSGTWGTAEEVPGTAALNQGGFAVLGSVSCPATGNCSASGSYTDASGNGQVFVVTQVNGTWGTAKEVPGTAALNQGGNATINSVSCAAAGNCSAGGFYTDASGRPQTFVVSQVNGTWGTAKEVPGTAALNQGGYAVIYSVSCAGAGNCSAGGSYMDSSGHFRPLVVSQVNGTWGTAKEVPGTAALNQGGGETRSVSCAAAGNCSAAGYYTDGSGNGQVFVVSQVNGTWSSAKEVPGTAALNQGGNAQIASVSCAAAGNCSAGGLYTDASGSNQAFVVSQANGTWSSAKEVPGTAALNQGGNATINSVSCAAAGNCSAGGYYASSSGSFGHLQAFVVSQANGAWGRAKEVPGTAALNQAGNAQIASVSCATAGNCSAGGSYKNRPRRSQAFVVSQANGTWGTAEKVPGTAALNQGGIATINSVSCATADNCGAGGSYLDSSGHFQAFVVNKS